MKSCWEPRMDAVGALGPAASRIPTSKPRYVLTDTGELSELLGDTQRRWQEVRERNSPSSAIRWVRGRWRRIVVVTRLGLHLFRVGDQPCGKPVPVRCRRGIQRRPDSSSANAAGSRSPRTTFVKTASPTPSATASSASALSRKALIGKSSLVFSG
jgi:hypothetical protein